MSYESRLIVVERSKYETWCDYVFAEEIARFDLRSVSWNHKEIFTEPIDFDILSTNGERVEYKKTDCYGEHCCMADMETVISALEKLDAEEDYRRYKPILGLLKGFNPNEWHELKVVHYGY